MKYEKIIWIAIFILGFGIRATEITHPIDTKSWRESDVSSIARNYYRNGMDFCKPQIDWGGVGPGYTESEFPLYPYLIALVYKVFGMREPIGRIISFLFSLGAILVFFRLSMYLLDKKKAIASSFFFAVSPVLMITSVTIQTESIMFFFYIGSAYSFLRWIDSQSKKYYILTIALTALAILSKISAINIGIFFLIIILIRKGRLFFIKPRIIIFGLICILPSIFWYSYSYKFYLHYGNSLGMSNEYHWIGWDFFTNSKWILGILINEIIHIWTIAGLLIFLLAYLTNKADRKEFAVPFYWYISAIIFYFVTIRTSADNWAFYYHIFSSPSVSLILGISSINLYNKFLSYKPINFKDKTNIFVIKKVKIRFVLLYLLLIIYVLSNFSYLLFVKPHIIRTSELYASKSCLLNIIPKGSTILVSGQSSMDNNYPLAYNTPYFFYWLDMKGFNISADDQSLDNVLEFKAKGAEFYIAETRILEFRPGFKESLEKNFKLEFEGNGILLFKL
jgi:hypothetical protein